MAKTIRFTKEEKQNHKILTEVMGLEDLDVVRQTYDEETNTLYLSCASRWEIALCPDCSEISQKIHDYPKQRSIHDAPLRGKRVILLFDTTRFDCEFCRKPFTQEIRDVVADCTYTHRLEAEIANPKRKQDVATLATLYGVGYKLVESIILKAGEAKIEARRKEPIKVRQMGVDELSQKKGRVTTSWS